MDNTKEFTHISLCAGYGGIDIGLKRAIGNVRTIALSEIEAYACANLVAKMEKGLLDSAPIWTDLKTFPFKQFCGKVDILSGGFPCQPFSTAGTRAGDNDPRHLFPYIKRGIKLSKPAVVFLENVQGIFSAKLKGDNWSDPAGTPVLQHVLRELERLDYKATASIFSACEVNAPHQRKRVFILAVSNQLTETGYKLITESIKQPRKSGINKDLSAIERYYSRDYRTAYPSFREQEQYGYEAPRTIEKQSKLGNTNHTRLERQVPKTQSREEFSKPVTRSSTLGNVQGIFESKMGGTVNGFTCGMDTSKQFTSYDNRTDELRMLGNGVVPDTASRAFKVLWETLGNTMC